MIVFVTLFATNLIEVQQCRKAVNFCWIFVGGSLFHGIKLSQINEKSSKFAIITSHVVASKIVFVSNIAYKIN